MLKLHRFTFGSSKRIFSDGLDFPIKDPADESRVATEGQRIHPVFGQSVLTFWSYDLSDALATPVLAYGGIRSGRFGMRTVLTPH